MPNYVLGKDCKAYASATPITAGANSDYATALAAATLFSNVKDLKLNFSTEKADISTRASGGWKATAATIKDGTITFTMLWKPADANFGIIKTAWLASAEIFFGALDGVYGTAGNQGPAGNFTVTNFSRSEGLNESVTVDVELSPSSFNGWFTAA